jgi:Tfp pilus assembly protein PilN
MDLNKEIKLSDLFRRGGKGGAEDAPTEEKPAKEKKPRKSLSFSLSRGEKAPKEPKAPKAPKEKAAVASKSAPAPPAVPLMRAFDLMPKEGEREKSSSLASPQLLKVGLALVAILLLAAFAGAYMMMDASAKEKQSEADDLRAQLAELTAQAAPDQGAAGGGTASLAAEGQARTVALSDALSARVAWDRILREFSLVLPEDVWLTTLSSTSGTTSAVAGAVPTSSEGTFTINGFASSQADVALLLSRLAVVPEFSNVQLQTSARGADATVEGGASASGDPSDFSFSIVATIAPEGVPSQ